MTHDGVEDALRVVAEHFGVSVTDIRSQRRSRDVHPARVWATYLASKTTDATFEQIGASFRRDHTVVRMYARAQGRAVDASADASRLFDLLRSRRS